MTKTKTKVFALLGCVSHEGDTLLSIHATRAGAEAAQALAEGEERGFDDYEIAEFTVEP